MQATYQEKKEIVLRVQKLDSMGRTKEIREAMEKNDPRPPKLGETTTAVHELVTENCGEFPKAMYRLALKNGLPAGDVASPDYPMPWDIAEQNGLTNSGFKVIGRNRDSLGNVVVRHPYVTRLVGKLREDLTVDLDAARAEEKKLRAQGWVSSPSEIKGLPTPPSEQGFDALPDEPNGNVRTGKAA
jgi:hypothetical protein